MGIKAVLFDLDGTILPMGQNVFTKAYFGGLAKRLAPIGYESEKLIDSIWQGSAAMVGNDVTEDIAAESLGINVFLLTDNLINKENKDISQYPNCSFDKLM